MADTGFTLVTGRLVANPEFFGEGDIRRAVFTVAFNRGKDDRRKSTFVDCIAWAKRSVLMDLFSKGQGISVQGQLETDSWETKDGQKRSKLRVNVNLITRTAPLGGERSTEEPSSTEGVTIPATGEGDIPF